MFEEETAVSEACLAALNAQFPESEELSLGDNRVEFAYYDANRDNQISQSEFLAN